VAVTQILPGRGPEDIRFITSLIPGGCEGVLRNGAAKLPAPRGREPPRGHRRRRRRRTIDSSPIKGHSSRGGSLPPDFTINAWRWMWRGLLHENCACHRLIDKYYGWRTSPAVSSRVLQRDFLTDRFACEGMRFRQCCLEYEERTLTT